MSIVVLETFKRESRLVGAALYRRRKVQYDCHKTIIILACADRCYGIEIDYGVRRYLEKSHSRLLEDAFT